MKPKNPKTTLDSTSARGKRISEKLKAKNQALRSPEKVEKPKVEKPKVGKPEISEVREDVKSVKETKKNIKGSDDYSKFEESQKAVQDQQQKIIEKSAKDEDVEDVEKSIKDRDNVNKPQLTGILRTNNKLLDVLTKMYTSSVDTQDTGFDDVPDTTQNTSPTNTTIPNKIPKKPEEEDDGMGLMSILGGALGAIATGLIFKKLLKFSPVGAMFKGFKSLTKLLSKNLLKSLKVLGNVGLKSLNSMVAFIKTLMPYAAKIIKTLTSMGVVKKATKVVKSTTKAASKVITKGGEKVAAKLAGKVALKAGAKVAARAATASVPIAGWVVTAGLTAMDAVKGYKNASDSLDVDKEELTTTNKVSSLISSVLTLGIGSKKLAKSINKTFGGEISTLIKRYENNNVIEHSTIFDSSVNFEKFTKLKSNEMKEVFSIDDFSNKDMDKMEKLIYMQVEKEKQTLTDNKNSKKTFDNKQTNKVNDTFNKQIVQKNKDMSFDYTNTKNNVNTYNKYGTENKITNKYNTDNKVNNNVVVNNNVENKNVVESDVNNNVENVENKNNQVNNNVENVENNNYKKPKDKEKDIEAVSNKKDKENSVMTNSKDMVQNEINKTNQFAAQIQQTNVSSTQVSENSKETEGSDRVLNLFSDLT